MVGESRTLARYLSQLSINKVLSAALAQPGGPISTGRLGQTCKDLTDFAQDERKPSFYFARAFDDLFSAPAHGDPRGGAESWSRHLARHASDRAFGRSDRRWSRRLDAGDL